MTAAVRAGLIESSASRSARLLRIPTVVRRGGRIRFGGAKQSRLRRRRAGRTLTVSGGTRPTPPVVANLAHHSAVGLFVVVTAGPEYLLFLCDVYAPRLAADRAAAPLSPILRSLAPNRKRRASRQRCACRRARPSGSVGGPPLPRLRESSRCLPAARSAATGKHTSLSLPLAQQSPSADARVAAAETNGRGVCGDRRRPRSQITKRKRGCNNGTMARAFRRRRRRRRGPPPSCRTDR